MEQHLVALSCRSIVNFLVLESLGVMQPDLETKGGFKSKWGLFAQPPCIFLVGEVGELSEIRGCL